MGASYWPRTEPDARRHEETIFTHRFDLIAVDGDLLGLIETERRDSHLWIENIAVLPQAQGRGLGRQLLAQADDLARTAGFRKVGLLTNARMLTNIELYQRDGHVLDREEPWNDGKIVYMVRRIG